MAEAMERVGDEGGIEQLKREHDRPFPIHDEHDARDKKKCGGGQKPKRVVVRREGKEEQDRFLEWKLDSDARKHKNAGPDEGCYRSDDRSPCFFFTRFFSHTPLSYQILRKRQSIRLRSRNGTFKSINSSSH